MQSFNYVETDEPALESAALHAGINRFSVMGIAATALGTTLAVNLLPDDSAPTGALFSAALVMAVGLAIAPLAAALRYPKSLLRGENLLALSPIYWLLLDLLQGTYPLEGIGPEEIRTAFIGIGLFVVAVWAAVSYRPWKVPCVIVRSVSQDFPLDTFFLLSIAAFLLAMLKFAIPANFDIGEMVSYLGRGRWEAPWGRGQLGGWDAFLDQLQYFGYLLPTLTVIVGHRGGWASRRTLLCTGMTIIIAIFLAQSGSRRLIGVIFGMALIIWVLIQQRLRTKQVLGGLVAAAALLFSLQIMLDYRLSGFDALIEGQQNPSKIEAGYVRVDDNFYRLCQVIQLIPESYPHTYHKYFIWVLVRPIPRVFWPGKPVDPGFDLSSAVRLGGISLSTSVIGELYMAAGFIGIVLGGWFYGRLAGMASRLLSRRTTFAALIIYATLMMSLFTGVRSMVELVLVNYVLLSWIALSRFYVFFKAKDVSNVEVLQNPR